MSERSNEAPSEATQQRTNSGSTVDNSGLERLRRTQRRYEETASAVRENYELTAALPAVLVSPSTFAIRKAMAEAADDDAASMRRSANLLSADLERAKLEQAERDTRVAESAGPERGDAQPGLVSVDVVPVPLEPPIVPETNSEPDDVRELEHV